VITETLRDNPGCVFSHVVSNRLKKNNSRHSFEANSYPASQKQI